ncbi:MAG: penicillin-binding protein 2 [Bacillota bacterium]
MVNKKPVDPIKGRIRLFTGLVLITFVALIGQLGRLTLAEQGRFLEGAEQQRLRQIPLYAPRGVIYDRNGVELAGNRPAYSVFIRYPYYERPEVLQRLATILQIPVAEITAKVRQKTALWAYYEPVRLKDDITLEQYSTILERKHELPGVEVQAQAVRVYPNKELAAHMLGYVGEISDQELESWRQKGYMAGELIGQTGLEAYYEERLRGTPGIRQIEVNSGFEPLGEEMVREPRPGHNLVLTIDSKLQAVAEQALEWDMWRIRNIVIGDGPWPNARAGSVVVMDVKTGAILAMASRPAFDPNLFATGISQKDYDRLQDPLWTPMINRAVQKAYQPGSTWKMMTSAAALEASVIGPYDKIFCSGVYDKAGNPKDWTPYGHGYVSTVGALQGSCDIYYYEMGYRMGPDKLAAKAKEFGFGEKTGIDLGGEVPGLLPDEETRELIWDKQLNDPWGVGHTVSASIGQIVQVTPLQLVRYTAALGNQGKVMKPYLVQRIADAQGRTVEEFGPQQTSQVSLKPEHLNAILQGMVAVDTPGGTSDYAIWPLPGIPKGGKTGTAENPPRDDYGLYVSLAPIDDPQIAVAVVIEQAAHGSNTSAVARTIEAAYFNIALSPHDPAHVPQEFPYDLQALRRKYRVVGSGD